MARRIKPVDTRTAIGQLRDVLYKSVTFGVHRRNEIVRLLTILQQNNELPDGIMVNRRYCIVLKHDNDLQYLLSKGVAKLHRVVRSRRTSYTYFQIVGVDNG